VLLVADTQSVVHSVSTQSIRIIAIVSENCSVAQQLVSEFYEGGLTDGYAYILMTDSSTCDLVKADTRYALLLAFNQSVGERFDAFVNEIGKQMCIITLNLWGWA
jgi:hypothetical protein